MEKSNKKAMRFIGGFIVLTLLLGAFAYSYYKKSLQPMSMEDTSVKLVEVLPGSSTKKISESLFDEKIIRNKLVFNLHAKYLGLDGKLKAGKYELSRSMALDEIINYMVKGGKSDNTVRFTVPEGYELYRIAERLGAENIVDEERFLELTQNKGNFEEGFEFLKQLEEGQSLEGFLFPSTYEVYDTEKEEDIIIRMLREFEKIYISDLQGEFEDFNMDLNEIITLASIIEREGKLDKERPIMSAVFHNRIKDGMYLQSCATVQYILGERKEVLSTADTRIPSPYNTYINEGLPPAPISSPGKESILAAVNPADVDYLFFVLTGEDGSHTFTKTYSEHLKAKAGK